MGKVLLHGRDPFLRQIWQEVDAFEQLGAFFLSAPHPSSDTAAPLF
jgi:hypothetical protein